MGWLKAPLQLAMLSTIVLLAGCKESVFDCSTVTTIPTAECEALLVVHNTADGGGWTDDAGWLMSADPCVWSGVSCSDEQVVQVRLVSNKLTGLIPAELGNLTALGFLDLSGNQLSGPIPTELGNLTALSNLVLSRNNLTGSIPAELGNLTALRSLRLGRNQLSGVIPTELGNLTNLEVLFIHTNQLTGLVPLPVAGLGGELQQIASDRCSFVSNPDLVMPDSRDYMDADLDDDGSICGVALSILP
jgi:Leucine-rich repeat (LRR) protein